MLIIGRFFSVAFQWLGVARRGLLSPRVARRLFFQNTHFSCFGEKCRATFGKPSAPLTIGKGLHMMNGH